MEALVAPLEAAPVAAPPTATRVAVVIVTYRCRELIAPCLDSLRAHAAIAGAAPEVWVVDNGSDDGTQALIAAHYPEVRLLQQRRNLGFSAANNLALRRIQTPYVLLLNPDCRLHAGALPHLVQLLDRRPEVGIAGCRLLLADGRLDHASRRAFPTLVGALAHLTRVGGAAAAPRALAQYRAPDAAGGGLVDAVNGAFMLIRRTALDAVGLFDEGYWLYAEDLDLCFRFARGGWRVHYAPEVTTTHLKGAISGRPRRPRANGAFHYGMFRFYRKYYATDHHALLNAAVYGGIAARLLASLLAAPLRRRRQALRGASAA
jgi:GT2 family glycosyltransferase